MPNPRKCCISDDLFSGFEIIIDLDYYDSLGEIVDYVKSHLIKSLNKINLEFVAEKAKKKIFHIHDRTIGQILINENDSTIWICGHCVK
jgi:hypothetical protein|tara:strand:+ start:710 stop:976 length:267 start_codon:yes stop_codon:yes gene_type:complete